MRTRSVLACAVALLFVVSSVAAGADPGVAPQPAADAEVEYDSTLLRVDLGEGGNATWTIEYRVNLDDQNTTDAFESLQEDVRANRSEFESQFADRMNRTARAAENATDREMTIRNVSVGTSRDEIQQVGIVAYTLTWTNFAVAPEGELRAGDAISGFVLDDGTTLFFTWPDAYGEVDVTPEADERRNGSATWIGPDTFANDEPRLVLERGGDTPGADAPTGDTPTGDGPPVTETTTVPPGEGGFDPLVFGVGVVFLLGLVAAAWYARGRAERDSWVPGATTGGTAGGPGGDAGGSDGNAGTGGASAGTAAAAGGGAGDDGEASGDAGGAAGPPEELLSNEERVLRLLEGNGGRMKQQQVVTELDWTDAKTSQVVGSLREDEEIEVFRIGRENVLALPGETDF
jgi:hypothetical protein